jgi:DNA repair exonuclease SbcCD ATPase subunit
MTTPEPSSSGAGKSRMWKLFLYLFYGSKALGNNESIKQAEVVGKNFRLEVAFKRQGKTYLVREVRSHDRFEDGYHLYEVTSEKKLLKIGEVNDPRLLRLKVQKILGMTYGEMIGMVIWPQGFGHSLVVGKPSERINFLSSVYGLTKYDDVYEELQAKLKEVRDKISNLLSVEGEYNAVSASTAGGIPIDQLKVKYQQLESSIKAAEAKSSVMRASVGALNRKIDRIESISSHWHNLKKVTSELRPDELALLDRHELVKVFDKSCLAVSDTLLSIQLALKAEKRITQLESTLTKSKPIDAQALKARLHELDSDILPNLRSLPSVTEQELADAGRAVNALKSKIVALANALKLKTISFEAIDNAYESAKSIVDAITLKLQHEDELHKELTQLRDDIGSSDCRCPKCKQLVDQRRLDSMISHAAHTITTTDAQLVEAEQKEQDLSSLKSMFDDFTKLKDFVESSKGHVGNDKKLKALEAEADAIQKDLEDDDVHKATRIEIDSLRRTYSKFIGKDLARAEAHYRRLVDDNQKKRTTFVEAQYAKDAISEALASLNISEDEAEDLLVSVSELVKQSDSESASLDKLNSKITQAYVTLSGYRNTIQSDVDKTRKLKALQSKVDELKKLREQEYVITQTMPAYSNSGLKMDKLKSLLASLAERLPYWTKLLFTEKNFSIEVKGDSKKLSLIAPKTITVGKEKKTIKVDIAALSGGEQSRVAICLMLAMADIVAKTKRANMLVFDEVDRHMDLLGQRLTASFLVPNLRRRKSALYLISHSQMIDAASFDRKLVITKHPTGVTDIKYQDTKKRK